MPESAARPRLRLPDAPRPAIALPLLIAISLIVSFVGLDTHGTTSWHEGQRLVVAREMAANHSWLVPTVNDTPYLAKPPLFYWAQIALARATGSDLPQLWHLRLVAALCGLVATLGMYGIVLKLLEPPWGDRDNQRTTAFWAGAMLATGILVVRSTRVAELDIMLLPEAVLGVGGVALAWRRHLVDRRAAWGAIALATLAGIAAALTKGPPGVLAILVGGYGAMLLHAAWSDQLLDGAIAIPGLGKPQPVTAGAPSRRIQLAAGLTLGIAVGVMVPWGDTVDARSIAGGVVMAAMGFGVGTTLVRLTIPQRILSFVASLSRTHPILVLGLPMLAFVWWTRAVAGQIGGDEVARLLEREAGANFHLFPGEAPMKMLEAALFGAGLGSFASIGALVWFVRDRPRLTPPLLIAIAWSGLGLLVFSVAGRGHGRYLTPIWPGLALLGAITVTDAMRHADAKGHLKRILWITLALLTVGQGVWYSWGREQLYAYRSPRAFIAELLTIPGVEPDHIACYEFYRIDINYYLDARIQPIGHWDDWLPQMGPPPWTLERFADQVRSDDTPWIVLVATPPEKHRHGRPVPIDRLRAKGFTLEPIEIDAPFRTEKNNAWPVSAWRVVGIPPIRAPRRNN